MATKSAAPVAPSNTANSAKNDAKSSNLRRMPRTLAGSPQPDDATRRQTLALYESALKLMQSGKYDKAHQAFSQMLQTAPQDLADRIRVYIAACVAQIVKGSTKFESNEERYDYAISLLNQGQYEDARQEFEQILKQNDSADYAFYGLALLASMTGDTQECIDKLREALDSLWAEVIAGQRRFKLYRQMKMYNDPALNPVLYGARTTR